jgi:hypothetical protein
MVNRTFLLHPAHCNRQFFIDSTSAFSVQRPGFIRAGKFRQKKGAHHDPIHRCESHRHERHCSTRTAIDSITIDGTSDLGFAITILMPAAEFLTPSAS